MHNNDCTKSREKEAVFFTQKSLIPGSIMLGSFFMQEHTLELYKVCLDLIHAYTSSNTGRYRGTGLDLDEEESCEDLLQFLKMMTHLTVKDYVDFGNTQG